MRRTVARRPIGNFFIKRALQIRLITKIVIAALFSTLVSSGALILVYFLKYETTIIYQLEKLTQELHRDHIINLILPTLVLSSIVNVVVAIGVGLYASRKYAVPIYKLEQWATLLQQGKMTANLKFREKEEMQDLCNKCNELSLYLREKFSEVRKQADALKIQDPSALAGLEKVLDGMELEASAIEVTTNFYAVTRNGPGEDPELTVKNT